MVDKDKLTVLDEFSVEKEEDNETDITTKMFVAELRVLKTLGNTYLKTMSTVRIMTIFLYNLKDYVEEQTMLNFEDFLEHLVAFINKHYHEVLMSYAEEAGTKFEI